MKKKKRILQILPTLSFGDGVGNDTLAMNAILKRHGFNTAIYARNIDERLEDKAVRCIDRLPVINDEDIILYHLSTGDVMNDWIAECGGKKIFIYHNITPHEFFEGYSEGAAAICKSGRESLARLKSVPSYVLADSQYNKEELVRMGYKCPIEVLPILIPFEDYTRRQDMRVLDKYYGDGYTNILFTGRIAPNKKQEDIIEAFYYYRKYYNEKSRLFLVGSFSGMEVYYKRLLDYVKKLNLNNVIFTGHISFSAILAYYRLADVFLCLSEHEGFCIPLVEAMLFEKPIIAYKSTGVTGTMGGAGILLDEKKPLEVAGAINYMMTHEELRLKCIENGKKQLERFETGRVEEEFMRYINKVY